MAGRKPSPRAVAELDQILAALAPTLNREADGSGPWFSTLDIASKAGMRSDDCWRRLRQAQNRGQVESIRLRGFSVAFWRRTIQAGSVGADGISDARIRPRGRAISPQE